MHQNAVHLVYLALAMLGTMLLPIAIGLVAVLAERAPDPPPPGPRSGE